MTYRSRAVLRLRTDAIRAAMASKGLSNVEQLAEVLGCSRSTVAHAMSGARPPGNELIAALRLRMNIPWEFIVEPIEVPIEEKRSA